MYFISNKQETNYIVNQEGPNNYSQAPLDLKTRYLNISQIDLGNASHNQSWSLQAPKTQRTEHTKGS